MIDEGRPLESIREAISAMGTDRSSDRSSEQPNRAGELKVYHKISYHKFGEPPLYYLHFRAVLEAQIQRHQYLSIPYQGYRTTDDPDQVDCEGCLTWIHS